MILALVGSLFVGLLGAPSAAVGDASDAGLVATASTTRCPTDVQDDVLPEAVHARIGSVDGTSRESQPIAEAVESVDDFERIERVLVLFALAHAAADFVELLTPDESATNTPRHACLDSVRSPRGPPTH